MYHVYRRQIEIRDLLNILKKKFLVNRRDVYETLTVYEAIAGYSRIYEATEGHTRVYETTEGYERVYKAIEGYTRVSEATE